jgi:4-aminobutyrate aminotransferase-like enzyme/Ser/Thr protein kinase RdoA (MazF antagonist)
MVQRPDPLVVAPPKLAEEAAKRSLLEHFGVAAETLSPLAGERDLNFRAETAGGQRFLFKISNPADDRTILELQAAALRHIQLVNPALPVMRVLPGLAGQDHAEVTGYNDQPYLARLFTFLPGRTTPNSALTAAAIRSFGQTTAELGRALRGFFHPAADYEILWDLKHASRVRELLPHITDDERRQQVQRVLDRFEANVAPVLPTLRGQVIHGDMSLDNVLLDDGLKISGIVDFGDMTHTALLCDLAVAVADVLHGRDDALDAAEAMIAGYASVTPLEDAETALLADLVATRLAIEVAISAWRNELYPGHAAYSETGEPGCRAFLDSIEAAGFEAVGRRFRDAAAGLPYRRVPTADLLARRRRVLPSSPLFYRDPVHLIRGDGAWLFDADGRRYLDCYNNVPVVGHGHRRVASAVAEQQRMLATHSRYLHEAIVELAERLTGTMPSTLDAVLVVNSGSEANDLAWRIARAATGRSGALVTSHAYHGVTEATHALSPEEWAKGEQPAHVATVQAPDGYRGAFRREQDGWALRYAAQIDDAVLAIGDRGLAAMYVDPGFTAEGILAPPPDYLSAAAGRVRTAGGLLIADEVQAGYGRAGTGLWSFGASGIEPDMVVLGKPMGNGFPVAALIVRSDLLAAVPQQTELFSTFGGNPVACAAALAVLEVIEADGLVQRAAQTGSYLRQGLLGLADTYELIGDVRGNGLLIGIELVTDQEARLPAADQARQVTEAMRQRGVLLGATGPDGNVLKIRPPLVFGREHADLLLSRLDEVLAGLPGR